MRVVLLNDSFPPIIDGVANVVMNYGRIMTETGKAEIVVGTPRYPNVDYTGYPYAVVPYQSIDTTGIVAGYRAGNPFAMKEIEQMAVFRPDIIHSHCPISSTVMARILRNETGAPVVFTYHTKFDVDIARAIKGKFLQKESAKVLADNISACDEVWVVSRGAGENLKSLGYAGEYRVMPNGVDFARGRVSDEVVQKAVAKYDLPADVPVFLFVGRMMKYKGLPLILDAMKLLAQAGMEYRMVFVGGGADAEEMQQKALADGIADRVIFTGPEYDREVLRAWNTRADLFLFPSTYDTNGIVVREAAACGLASVLIRNSCAAEGITDGRNGYIIEETAEAMAVRLKEVCVDMDRVHQVGQHAMDEIYISWDTAVAQAHARYGEILELKNRGMLPARKHETSDYFLNIAAGLFESTDKVFSAPKRFYEGMQENVAEMREELRANMAEMREDIQEKTHELRKDIKADLKADLHEVRNIIMGNVGGTDEQ